MDNTNITSKNADYRGRGACTGNKNCMCDTCESAARLESENDFSRMIRQSGVLHKCPSCDNMTNNDHKQCADCRAKQAPAQVVETPTCRTPGHEGSSATHYIAHTRGGEERRRYYCQECAGQEWVKEYAENVHEIAPIAREEPAPVEMSAKFVSSEEDDIEWQEPAPVETEQAAPSHVMVKQAHEVKPGDFVRPYHHDKNNSDFVKVISVEFDDYEGGYTLIHHKDKNGDIPPFRLTYRARPSTRFEVLPLPHLTAEQGRIAGIAHAAAYQTTYHTPDKPLLTQLEEFRRLAAENPGDKYRRARLRAFCETLGLEVPAIQEPAPPATPNAAPVYQFPVHEECAEDLRVGDYVYFDISASIPPISKFHKITRITASTIASTHSAGRYNLYFEVEQDMPPYMVAPLRRVKVLSCVHEITTEDGVIKAPVVRRLDGAHIALHNGQEILVKYITGRGWLDHTRENI